MGAVPRPPRHWGTAVGGDGAHTKTSGHISTACTSSTLRPCIGSTTDGPFNRPRCRVSGPAPNEGAGVHATTAGQTEAKLMTTAGSVCARPLPVSSANAKVCANHGPCCKMSGPGGPACAAAVEAVADARAAPVEGCCCVSGEDSVAMGATVVSVVASNGAGEGSLPTEARTDAGVIDARRSASSSIARARRWFSTDRSSFLSFSHSVCNPAPA
mmetsp:Transcript_111518/g.314903  ORF Transcript_111518/g.314903 Transcript_111518/m.314903 type:complete len:214 (+) Transcript_111518:420-1061(+)